MVIISGNEYVIRRFSKTPLKHRMSKYLLEKLLTQEDLLERIVFVTARDYLSNTMLIAQAGTEGTGFELELGAVESEHITLVNGRLVKDRRKSRETLIHEPLEAIEVLQNFSGTLYVQFVFEGPIPLWYEQAALPTEIVPDSSLPPGFAAFIRDQIDLVLLAITLKHEIDEALRTHNEEAFREHIKLYKQVTKSCFWKLS